MSKDTIINSKAKGGIARAKKLSPEQRSEIAKNAALERWSEKPLRATHQSKLKIATLIIPCFVLENKTRVLSGRGILKLLGFDAKSSGTMLRNLFSNNNLSNYAPKDLIKALNNPVSFERPGAGGSAPNTYSYDATILIDICNAFLDAKNDGILLSDNQLMIVRNAEVILKAVAKIGIIALIDEATGYQDERPQDALQVYLAQIISKELAAWVKKFPDEFYENMYKLNGWSWYGMSKNRYSICGKYTADLVYERIAPNLLSELALKSPKDEKGNRPSKLHQWLTADVGDPMLSQHIHSLIMFQRLAISNGYGWKRFVKMVDSVLPKKGATLELPLGYSDANN